MALESGATCRPPLLKWSITGQNQQLRQLIWFYSKQKLQFNKVHLTDLWNLKVVIKQP